MYKTLTTKEYERQADEYDKVKYRCKHCGHRVVIPYNVDKKICGWCQHYVFKNPEDEFKYRLKEASRNDK